MKLSALLKKMLFPSLFHITPEVDEEGNTIGTGNDARLKLFNQIADNADKKRASEFYETDEEGNEQPLSMDDPNPEEETDEEEEEKPELSEVDETEEETEEEPVVETKKKDDDPPLTQQPQKYKIKVNGVEKEVDVDYLLQQAQKVESADDYLREAKRLSEDTRNLRETKQPPKTVETPPDEVQLARAIQMGSEEEAVAAIRSLRSQGPSSDDLARTIDERLNFQNAIQEFSRDYADIVGDPILRNLAVQEDNRLRAEGDTRSYVDRYKAIGDSLRDWVKTKAPEVKEEKVPEVKVDPKKKTNKAAAPSVPKAATGKVGTPEPEEQEESTSDVIANMAKSRGGPQWMRS